LHEVDPKRALFDKIGDLSELELFNNQVLCAIYVRPEKTRSGILLADTTRDEDRSQSKVGMILKTGPSAFVDPEKQWFAGEEFAIGDWIFYRASDGWATTINGVPCRILEDTNVRGRIQHPDMVW
jgi:co-chaperonin GroES (HSP10)